MLLKKRDQNSAYEIEHIRNEIKIGDSDGAKCVRKKPNDWWYHWVDMQYELVAKEFSILYFLIYPDIWDIFSQTTCIQCVVNKQVEVRHLEVS